MKVNNPHNYIEPLSGRLREIALDIKEIAKDANTKKTLLRISSELYEMADDLEGVVSCDICADYHDKDSVPLSCESGDGL